MSRRRKNNRKTGAPVLHCLNPHAAGVDVGATEIYIAVPVDRDPQPVRRFSTFTEDLRAAAAWLKSCHIETVRATQKLRSIWRRSNRKSIRPKVAGKITRGAKTKQ